MPRRTFPCKDDVHNTILFLLAIIFVLTGLEYYNPGIMGEVIVPWLNVYNLLSLM